MLDLNPDTANKIAIKRTDVDDITPVKKAFMLRFTGTNRRWMGIAREERLDWVTVYINRQSRALDWFPVSDPGRFFEGVEIGYRYVKGHRGKGKNPGMAGSIAKLTTLNPEENHVLLLHCAKRAGFEELVKWYSGERVLGIGRSPSPTEISGEGPYAPLESSAASASLEAGPPGDMPSDQSMDMLHEEVAVPADPSLSDAAGNDAGTELAEDGDDAGSEDETETGGGWMADPERRKAVEMHAVGMAIARYVSMGFQVEERGKPFDLLCTPTDACAGAPTVHVEVKGSLGSAMTVHLTRNEVEDARGDGPWRSDLYIVSGISLTQQESGAWVAAGGSARWIEGWCPLDDHLTPTDFMYVVPRSVDPTSLRGSLTERGQGESRSRSSMT